jgi:PAS domain S-box-containing protein
LQEAHFREQAELLELTHDAIFVRSLERQIGFWNRAAERLYGWKREEAQGKISHDLLQTVFPRPLAEIEAEVFEKGTWEGELIHTCRDGSKRIVSSRWALRTSPEGNPISVLESNRDITARRQEEEKFRGLLESAPDAMVIVNGDGRIQLVNARAEVLFGYSRSELIGQPVEIVVPDRFRAEHIQARVLYSQCPASRSMGENIELFGRKKDGSEFPVEVSLSPLETAEGTLISSAIRDVTDRRRIQQDLRDVNEFLDQRVNARTQELATANAGLLKSQESVALAQKVARIGTFEIDGATNRSTWSPGMEELYGLAEGTFGGTRGSWLSMVHPLDRARAATIVEAAIAERKPYVNEYRILRADGQVRWIRAQGQLFFDRDGRFLRLVGVNLDITDRRNKEDEIVALNAGLERRVEERTAELVRANNELESFSYSVSHDLRAPLRHIDGFARILLEDFSAALPDDARSYLTRIVKATSNMGQLVDDLIKLAHIGRREFVTEKIPLGDVVKAAIAELPPGDPARSIEWRVELLPTVDCDPGLLKLVFINLLSNAVKFTRGRSNAFIEIGSQSMNDEAVFFVRDNGVGFDPQFAGKLFGVFQRLHPQEKFEGTGIGLATVQRIIQRHGGRIWAESELDRGSTFYFTLGPGSQPALADETQNLDSLLPVSEP